MLVLVAAGCGCKEEATYAKRLMCVSNLKEISRAKQAWAKEQNKTTNDVPVLADLTNHMKGVQVNLKSVIVCPSGGTYTVGPVGKNPTCSVKGHQLDADWTP